MNALSRRLCGFRSRVASVLRRRRLDGRLAEPTAELLSATIRHRRRAIAARAFHPGVTPGSPPLRLAPGWPAPGHWARWRTDAELDRPLSDLSHDLATEVVERLQRYGLQPFLIASGHHVHLGLPAEDRSAALVALGDLDGDRAWYLRWRRGNRWRCRRLGSSLARRARSAESWQVFRCRSIGSGYVAGPEQAVELSFWTVGANDRRERLGYRGLQRFELSARPTVEVVEGREYPGLTAFAVSSSIERVRFDIDAVITWVDGDDEGWRASFEHHRGIEQPDARDDHAAHPSRYTSHDELRYLLRSIWMHAGWVRRIFVVTADQQPDWLIPDERLVLVSHRDLLPADALPTFNSHAIESRLHHIDGLSEHFIYFNDDMFLGRALRPEQFFTPNGLSRFFDSDARIPDDTGAPALAADTAARRGRAIIEAEFGTTVTHKLHHAPYALRRSVMAEVEERFAEVVSATTRSRFRHPNDLSIPSAFAHHYAFMTGRAVPGDLRIAYENLGSRKLGLFLDRIRLGADAEVFCINETERWETSETRAHAQATEFLEHYFAIASPWERAQPEAPPR